MEHVRDSGMANGPLSDERRPIARRIAVAGRVPCLSAPRTKAREGVNLSTGVEGGKEMDQALWYENALEDGGAIYSVKLSGRMRIELNYSRCCRRRRRVVFCQWCCRC